MSNKTSVTPLRNAEALTNLAANWFHSKWGIPSSAYEESIRQCQKEAHGIPPVSYTHLDVYKRQYITSIRMFSTLLL